MMLEPSTIDTVRETMGRLDSPFYASKHQDIYEAIASLHDEGEAVDLSTVAAELGRRDADVDDFYLTECTDAVGTATAAETLARCVAECAQKRNLARVAGELRRQAMDETTDVFDLMDEAEAEIISASKGLFTSSSPSSARDATQEAMKHLEDIHGADGGVTGVPTGFEELDDLTAGWQDSDLIIVAGRPSMGKTSFALCSAQCAAEAGTGVGVFSLEMSKRQLMQRLITSEARVDAQKARRGRLNDEEWQRLARASSKVADLPLFIDDTPSLTPLELRAKARRLKAEEDIGMVVIDYLGMMEAGSDGSAARRIDTREQEVAHISRSLKGIAKELDLPVMALVQMNRAVESRGGEKRPQLSDLRDSGRIEQDADVVSFIYRAERYGISQDQQGRSTEGIAEVMVEKQRNGPVGTVRLAFVKEYARFENLSDEDAPF
jgi:replicative DNA helicase